MAQWAPALSPVTVTLQAPANLAYDGTAKAASVGYSVEDSGLEAVVTYTGEQTNVTTDGFTATMTLGGVSVSKVYIIESKALTDDMLRMISEALEYTGNPVTRNYTVQDGSTTLRKGTNYTEEYTDNINTGDALLTLTGKGNYSGTVEAKFQITKSGAAVTAKSYLGETEQTTFTYGDTIIIKGQAAIDKTSAQIYALRAPVNTAELYYSDTKLAEYTMTDNTFTLTYDTMGKGIPVGTCSLTVEFGGNDNLNGESATVTITLQKADPVVTVPTGLTAIYGNALADVTLPTGWA